MRVSKLRKAKAAIVKLLGAQPSRVFLPSQLNLILVDHTLEWKIDREITRRDFIHFLSSEGILQEIKLAFPGKIFTRYILEGASVFDIALSLFRRSYLSHYSAVFVHHLTDQIPRTVYVNHEQKLSSVSTGTLKQSGIDLAFKNAPRISHFRVSFQDHEIAALNGKNTNNLGVIETPGPQGEALHVTNIERTLIDIAVRPLYAGGVFEVLNAYRRSADRVSINKLTALLKHLAHTYPYHQAIGFYLEKAGVYSEAQINLLRKAFSLEYDFYLVHKMKAASYSEKWRLYYPKGM